MGREELACGGCGCAEHRLRWEGPTLVTQCAGCGSESVITFSINTRVRWPSRTDVAVEDGEGLLAEMRWPYKDIEPTE